MLPLERDPGGRGRSEQLWLPGRAGQALYDADGGVVWAICAWCLERDAIERYGMPLQDASVAFSAWRRPDSPEEAVELTEHDEVLWETLVQRRRQLLSIAAPARRRLTLRGREARGHGLPREVWPLERLPAIVAHLDPHGELVRCGIYLHDADGSLARSQVAVRRLFPQLVERGLITRAASWERLFHGVRTAVRSTRSYVLYVRDVPPDEALDVVGELRAHADELQAIAIADAFADGPLPIVESWRLAAAAVDQVPAITAGAEHAAIVAERTRARDEVARTVAELREVAKP